MTLRRALHLRLPLVFSSAAILFAVAGCCSRPTSAWDQSTIAPRDALPGVVVIFDRARRAANCDGFVVASEAADGGFSAYVLTTRHCVADKDHSRAFGIATPIGGSRAKLAPADVLDATLAFTSAGSDETFRNVPVSAKKSDGIEWIENDWAILRVTSPRALPVLPVFAGDPTSAIAPGEPVTLASYHDALYADDKGDRLWPHEHPFGWSGVPLAAAQLGHAGAPIVRNGEAVALYTGTVYGSYTCELISAQTRPTKLRLVSIADALAQAKEQGFTLTSK